MGGALDGKGEDFMLRMLTAAFCFLLLFDAGPGALEMEISSLALAFGVVEGAANNDSENDLESGT